MITHDLKTWPEFFQAIWEGKKLFELRQNDRNFRVGDILLLREWNPDTREYTERCIQAEVTYILHSDILPLGYVVLSLNPKLVKSSQVMKAVKDQ
jgi:hypothetical protein